MAVADGYRIEFLTEELPVGILRPVSLSALEELGRPDSATVDLLFEVGALNAPALLRKSAEVVVYLISTGEVVRRFAGVVTRVRERVKHLETDQEVQVVIEPALALLGNSTDCRIFQNQTTREIVSTVLDECGIDAQTIKWRLSGNYLKREVCTQYSESILQFISRILEEDGIFYFTEQSDSGPTLVFGDGADAYTASTPNELVYHGPSGLFSGDAVTHVASRERMRSAKLTLRDHDFKKPSVDLETSANAKTAFDRERYEYPGRYVDPGEGKRRAGVWLAAETAENTGLDCRGTAFFVSAGHTVKLEQTGHSSWDADYVVLRVHHDWRRTAAGASRLEARFHLLPKSASYHPARRTPRPRVSGLHTAIVTGPAGEEIYCDEFGRIKIQFHWDRHGKFDDQSSAWVRVGQMHTSGSVVIPRMGWEVLVDFEDGDPDKPVVLGRVYNAKFMPPSKLPDQMTASRLQSFSSPGGKGHNEIGVNDAAASETFNVHAQKDLNLVVANNKTEKVTNDSSIGVVGNHDLSVGANNTVQVGALDSTNIGGSQTWSVAAVRTKTVSKDESLDVHGSRSVSIGAAHMLMTPKTAEITTTGGLTETVGGLCMEVAALEVGMMTAGSTSITVGAAKIEVVAAGKTDSTIGARASTIGGALINASGKDSSVGTSKSKATTVGGAWLANAGGDAEFSAAKALDITVGGAAIINATEIILKVGDSNVTLSGGAVVLSSKEVKLTATGPNAELAPMVGDK